MKRIGWLVLAGALAVSGAACGKKDKIIGPGEHLGPIYPVRSTPQNALLYYKAAWENRDTTRVDSVLAADYSGSSTDPYVGTFAFSKADEIRALGGIRLSQDVTAVAVDLHDPATWVRQYYAGDSAAWVSYSIPSPRIEVDAVYSSLVADASTFMEFKFRPTTPAPASPTDTLWTIVRWQEQD